MASPLIGLLCDYQGRGKLQTPTPHIPTASHSVLERSATLLGITTDTPDPEGACTHCERLRYRLFFGQEPGNTGECYYMAVQPAVKIDRCTS
jgi:hypothetical protein